MPSEAGADADAATTDGEILLLLSSSSPRGMRDGVCCVCASPKKGQNLNREPGIGRAGSEAPARVAA